MVIVGAGPAGLAAAITMKKHHADLDVCVLEKSASVSSCDLCSALVWPNAIEQLLDLADPAWRNSQEGSHIIARQVNKEALVILLGRKYAVRMAGLCALPRLLCRRLGKLRYRDSYVVSLNEITEWLSKLAVGLGVEIRYGGSPSTAAQTRRR